MANKPSYSHLTKGLQSVPMVLLRKRISNVKPRITEEKESSKRVRVLLNDQPHLNAITLVVQPNATWRLLMADIASKFSMAVQLRRLYTLDGMNISAFKQMTTGETYVASVGAFKPDSRLSPAEKPVWKNQQNPKGRRSSDISLLLKQPQTTEDSYSLDKPLTFYDDKLSIINSPQAGTKPNDIDTARAEDISQSGDISENNPTDSDLAFKDMPITDTAYLSLHNPIHERDNRFRNISFPSNESLPAPPTPELPPQKRSAVIVLGGDKVKVQVRSDSNISATLQEICLSLEIPFDPNYNLFSENGDRIKSPRQLFTTYRKNETFMAEKVVTKSQQRIQQRQQTPTVVNGMKLGWIFGGQLSRDVFVTTNEEIMFTSGSLVVLQNIQRKSQRFYTGHNESITCYFHACSLTLHHSTLLAASGQQSGDDVINDVASHDAHVRVWSVDNLAVTSQFGHGLLQGTVKKVEFSKTNEWLATVDLEHLTLWHWRNETALSRHRLGNGDVSVTSFIEEDTWLVTAGKNYFHFWQVHDNGNLRKSIKSGIFDGDSPDMVMCLQVSFNGDVITGDSNGDVTFWRKAYDEVFSMKRQIHADAGIRCMWNLADGSLVSAHEDGYVCSWDLLSENSFSKGKRKIGNSKFDVIMTSSRRGDDVLLCLSENCNLMQGTLQSAWSTTQLGHRSRVNGVTILSSYTEVCTCDSTGMVACWDLACKEKVWCTTLESETLCVDVHFDYEIALLGCKSSSFIVLSSRSGERVCSRSLPAPATCVKFDDPNQTGSPYVAIATDDRKIQIFLVLDLGRAYVLQSSVPFHSSTIVEIDWSNDARFLRLQSKHHDVMIYDVTKKNRVSGQPLTSSWRTNVCSDDVSITCQASFGDVSARCAVGGIVQLFRKKELLKQFKCSSSDITSVCMTSQYVILGGGSQEIPLLHLWELE